MGLSLRKLDETQLHHHQNVMEGCIAAGLLRNSEILLYVLFKRILGRVIYKLLMDVIITVQKIPFPN